MKAQTTQRKPQLGRRQRIRKAVRETSIAEKDWFRSLGIWVLLEGLCFGLAPYYGLIAPGDRWQNWFLLSIPAGIIGAILIAFSSQSVEHLNNQRTSPSKMPLIFLGQLIGGVGLAGILFPLMMVFLEFVSKAASEIMENGG